MSVFPIARDGDTVMPRTDTAIRGLKPADEAFKLADGGGLYLFVKPTGPRAWRMDYRFVGRRKTLSIGVYPPVGLVERVPEITERMAQEATGKCRRDRATLDVGLGRV